MSRFRCCLLPGHRGRRFRWLSRWQPTAGYNRSADGTSFNTWADPMTPMKTSPLASTATPKAASNTPVPTTSDWEYPPARSGVSFAALPLLSSAMYTLPLASTATPVGPERRPICV